MPVNQNNDLLKSRLDVGLLLVVAALVITGLIMVTSASISVAEKHFGAPFYYAWHQAIYLTLGGLLGGCVFQIPLRIWEQFALPLLFLSALALVLVLVPGIGKNVNGSTRWLDLKVIAFQVSELAKFSMVIFLARYIERHGTLVRTQVRGFAYPILILMVLSGLLLLEPDFGATVVVAVTTLSLLFLAGVPLHYFMSLVLLLLASMGLLIYSAPYRLKRLTTFLDPWATPFDSGYQLTQALIAFGRGEWTGVGLGSSVQKLFYLPEAHTDFLFAVLAEELGLLGAFAVIVLFILLGARGGKIALQASARGAVFAAFVAYGMSIWLTLQAFINIGVNTGILPTKGLTLPFLSYGGSSVLMVSCALSLILRVDWDNRYYARKEAGFAG
jgi:cell division protein FtsW